MFSKFKYIFFIIFILLISVFIFMFYNNNWMKNTGVDLSVYKPYKFNTEINFNQNGNTKDYIKYEDGWGGQEEIYRMNMGKESIIRLYIKDGKNKDILLQLDCLGIFNLDKEKFQTITLVANGKEVKKWEMPYEFKSYYALIPSDLMQDNTLVLNFITDKPYASPTDSRLRGMAVTKIILKNVSVSKTKKKIAKYIKEKLNSI